jgi:hypothetical protein
MERQTHDDMFDPPRGDDIGDAVESTVQVRAGDGLERMGKEADLIADRHPDPHRAVIDPEGTEKGRSGHR